MTDATTTPPAADDPNAQVASLGRMIVHDMAQKALTTLAVAMASKGYLSPGHEGQLVDMGVAVTLYGAGCAWTYLHAYLRRQKMLTLRDLVPPASLPKS